MTLQLDEIVAGGLCMGCGVCRSLAGPDRIAMQLTPEGRLRPAQTDELESGVLDRINAVCPGIRVGGADPERVPEGTPTDLMWGPAARLAIGFAGDPLIRHLGSTGGALTALSCFLVETKRVNFILHVAASRTQPMHSEARLSFDRTSIIEGAGSRYGPVAPLADFNAVLDRGEPFALVAKPCDITAVRNLAKSDPRVDRLMRYALTFLCGGSSDLTKSEEVLQGFGIEEEELALFRYRGFGNPGPTRAETKDGRAFEISYQKMWEDESKWMIQPRCKICADPIGESADLVASDVWPGGGPTGEDAGFNGIIARTARGVELFEAAKAAGAIVIEREVGFRDFDLFQPHQVRKRRAIWARFAGMRAAGRSTPTAEGLRLADIAKQNSISENLEEARGARSRARAGRLGEPPAMPRSAETAVKTIV
jgi:coenzyme F420 hydrogenase subunit beta